MRRTLLLTTALVLAAPGLTGAATHDELKESLRETETAFAKTMADRDHAAFASFLAAETVFFGARRAAGQGGRRRGMEGLLRRRRPAPFSWAPDSVEVLDSGQLGFSQRARVRPRGQACRHVQLRLAEREGRQAADRLRQGLPALRLRSGQAQALTPPAGPPRR